MTYLELVQKAYKEAGLTGDGPTTVGTAEVGIKARFVGWVADAWSDIQTDRRWDFMRSEGSFSLVVGTQAYDPLTLPVPITDIAEYDDDWGLIRKTLDDEGFIRWLTYQDLRDRFLRGNQYSGKPTYVAWKTDSTLVFNCLPDDTYTFTFQYWKTPQILSAATDTPTGLKSDEHDIIVWKALMTFGTFHGSPEIYGIAEAKYMEKLRRMHRRHIPEIQYARDVIA